MLLPPGPNQRFVTAIRGSVTTVLAIILKHKSQSDQQLLKTTWQLVKHSVLYLFLSVLHVFLVIAIVLILVLSINIFHPRKDQN